MYQMVFKRKVEHEKAWFCMDRFGLIEYQLIAQLL